MKTLTIAELYGILGREMKRGHGYKKVLVSDDEEVNGVHELFSGIDYANEELIECGINMPFGVTKENINDYIILF